MVNEGGMKEDEAFLHRSGHQTGDSQGTILLQLTLVVRTAP